MRQCYNSKDNGRGFSGSDCCYQKKIDPIGNNGSRYRLLDDKRGANDDSQDRRFKLF